MRLEVKFRESAPPDRRDEVIEKVRDSCAAELAPQFPGETDPQLASLFSADGVPEESADELVATLDALDDVEFAERAPKRKLIR